MRLAPVLALCLYLPAVPLMAQESASTAGWRGKLEIKQFNFVYGTGQKYVYGPRGSFVGTRPLVVRRVETWALDYDLYQTEGRVVREQLTRATGHRSVGPPRDIRLLDYDAGWGLVFDKGGSTALKGPLTPPAAPRDIGTHTILGFVCSGKKYEWKTWQGATVDLEMWTATGSGVGVPLLEVEHFTDKAGALLALTVQFVAQLEPATNLPESLFQPPKGLRVVPTPFIE